MPTQQNSHDTQLDLIARIGREMDAIRRQRNRFALLSVIAWACLSLLALSNCQEQRHVEANHQAAERLAR